MAVAFHIGSVTGHALPVHDSWLLHGVGLLRDVGARFAELDLTQLGSIVAIAGVVPTAWRFLQGMWREVRGWVRQCLLASVTIPGGDPLNRSVERWLLDERPQHDRFFTGRTRIRSSAAADPAAALKKTRHNAVQFLPRWGRRWVWFAGRLLLVERGVDGGGMLRSLLPTPDLGSGADGLSGEPLTISCFGWSAAPLMAFVHACRAHADRQAQFFVVVYARDRYGLRWTPKARTPLRLLETVHFDAAAKADLVADVRRYLDPRTLKRYQARSMPYRRGYLFYGPPGTGKTSLSVALAGEFGLDLYEVKIPAVPSDAELEQMFQDLPPRCVVLLEDIDAVWTQSRSAGADNRSRRAGGGHDKKDDEAGAAPHCTLSGLLNVLDGVGSQEGRLLIMTTNHPERLDAALVRPGRVDVQIFLGPISRASAEDMFVRMFAPDLGCSAGLTAPQIRALAAEFAQHIPDRIVTPSLLQGYFQRHLDSPHSALAGIAAWVEQELAGRPDYELVKTPLEDA